MFKSKFGLGELVLVNDLEISGVVMEIENFKTLNGNKELRYRVLIPNDEPMLLREDQLSKSGLEEKHSGYSSYTNNQQITGFEIPMIIAPLPFNDTFSDQYFNSNIKQQPIILPDKPDVSTEDEIELAMLDLLIDGSLDRKNKKEFLEHVATKKKLQEKISKQKSQSRG